MRVHVVPCLKDNYAYFVVCEKTGACAVVDASEAGPVISAARALDVTPRDVWSTHHHHDHVGGNEEVVSTLGVKDVAGHASDRGRIPGQTLFFDTGDTFTLGSLSVRTEHIPGHTLGAIAYVVTDPSGESCVFTGDTLFCAGCGRLFEGTPAQMNASLQRLAALPPATKVYCGHEYTEANLRFAKHVEPGSATLDRAIERARARRAAGEPTVPSTIADELATNPFLRAKNEQIRATLGIAPTADDVTSFAAIRAAKDVYRG